MVSAVIFIEGGGDGALHERSFRKAWSDFFRSAGLSGRMPAINPSRVETECPHAKELLERLRGLS